MALFVLILLCSGALIRACDDTERRFGSVHDSHWCYECRGYGDYCEKTPVICPIGFSKCISTTTVVQIGDTHMKIKQKDCIKECEDGSMNLGITKLSFTCCDTHFCNTGDAPDPGTNALNGRTCYYCDGQDCSKTVRCSGTEDRCITTTMTNRGLPMLVKGCVSKNICGSLKCSFVQNKSCCEGDLCNSD